MTRQQLKEEIINNLNPFQLDNWGYAANHIQQLAEFALSKEDFNKYLIKSNRDMKACDGMDGQLFNGQYFDWREYSYRGPEIINAFLDYFTNDNLHSILSAM